MEDNTNLNPLLNIQNEDDDDENLINDQQVGGIIGSAIIDLAKRVFHRQTIRSTQSTTPIIPTMETNILEPNCHRTNLNINKLHNNKKLKQCISKFLDGLWFKFDTCIIYLSEICFKLNYCCQCRIKIPKKTTFNFYINPCGYYYILISQFICKKQIIIKNNEIIQESIEKNNTNEKNDSLIISDESNDRFLSCVYIFDCIFLRCKCIK